MPQKLCLVCGFSAAEVEKLHNFPLNKQKSKIWQEAMGMVYSPGISLRNHRICSRHFTEASYTNLVTRKLRADAVPTLFPCRVQVDLPQELVTSESLDLSGVEEHLESWSSRKKLRLTAFPSQNLPSGCHELSEMKRFKHIQSVARNDESPTKGLPLFSKFSENLDESVNVFQLKSEAEAKAMCDVSVQVDSQDLVKCKNVEVQVDCP